MREWTGKDLQEYAARFSIQQKDDVLKELLEDDLLKQFLGTPGGQLIINKLADMISAMTGVVIQNCLEGVEKNKEAINEAAITIRIARNIMHNLATISAKGEEHKEAMKKK
jgi:hypothetical protein